MAWVVPLISAAASVAGKASEQAPAQPVVQQPTISNGIDFSNWTVATSGSKATASNEKAEALIPNWLKFAALALAAVVAVRWAKRKS